MSYNGSGTFQINTAGQPVVAGTVISSTAFNSLTADLANGLSTAITKDGQTTVTNNIPMSGFKITGLGAATVGTDAVRYSQIQSNTDKLVTVSGTDTLTGSVTPALTAYAAGNLFSFVVANTNTGAVTINIDGVGSKSITRTGSTALVAGDMVAGQVVLIEYDGTRFQLLNGNSFTNLNVSGNETIGGTLTYGGVTLTNAVTGTGKMVLDTSPTVNNPTVTNYVESVVAIGTVTSSNTIALTNGTVQTATLTASTACTFTMKNRKRANIQREVFGYNSDVYATTTYNRSNISSNQLRIVNPSITRFETIIKISNVNQINHMVTLRIQFKPTRLNHVSKLSN